MELDVNTIGFCPHEKLVDVPETSKFEGFMLPGKIRMSYSGKKETPINGKVVVVSKRKNDTVVADAALTSEPEKEAAMKVEATSEPTAEVAAAPAKRTRRKKAIPTTETAPVDEAEAVEKTQD